MLRVNVGLSRKLSKDFNSTGYSINLDGEVTAPVADAEAVVEQIHELFDLAEEALNLEIERVAGEAAVASRDVPATSTGPAANGRPVMPKSAESKPQNGANGNGNHGQIEPATAKQINYLLNIGKRQGLTTSQLETQFGEILNQPTGLYDLTKKSAATVIDVLTRQPAEAAAASRN